MLLEKGWGGNGGFLAFIPNGEGSWEEVRRLAILHFSILGDGGLKSLLIECANPDGSL